MERHHISNKATEEKVFDWVKEVENLTSKSTFEIDQRRKKQKNFIFFPTKKTLSTSSHYSFQTFSKSRAVKNLNFRVRGYFRSLVTLIQRPMLYNISIEKKIGHVYQLNAEMGDDACPFNFGRRLFTALSKKS